LYRGPSRSTRRWKELPTPVTASLAATGEPLHHILASRQCALYGVCGAAHTVFLMSIHVCCAQPFDGHPRGRRWRAMQAV
jgi:hypothetical protein